MGILPLNLVFSIHKSHVRQEILYSITKSHPSAIGSPVSPSHLASHDLAFFSQAADPTGGTHARAINMTASLAYTCAQQHVPPPLAPGVHGRNTLSALRLGNRDEFPLRDRKSPERTTLR